MPRDRKEADEMESDSSSSSSAAEASSVEEVKLERQQTLLEREARRFVRNVTLEPMIFFFMFGLSVVSGSSVNTNLLIEKVCRYEMGYNETVCDNLEDEAYADAETEVQREVNDIQLIQAWLDSGPSLVYVFFAGAMSDHFGRKPLMLFPLIGLLIGQTADILLTAFLEELPVEFFYLEQTISVFGGASVYYLGFYGFGSSFTEDADDRAHVLARYDGIESLARIIGTALSPVIFNSLDYYGSFGIRVASTVCAILYLILLVKEPMFIKKVEDKHKPGLVKKVGMGIYKHVIVGTWETLQTIGKERPHHMRPLIIIQLLSYACAIFTFTYMYIIYLYMLKVFDADGDDYAHMQLITDILATIGLLFLIPLLTGRLRVSEPAVLTFISFTMILGLYSSAFAKTLIGFMAANWMTFLQMSQFGPGRALITKSVSDEEIGKILSGNAILSAAIPLASSPIYRGVYDRTLETYPAAYILISAGTATLGFFLNFALWTQRSRFAAKKEADDEERAALGESKVQEEEEDSCSEKPSNSKGK